MKIVRCACSNTISAAVLLFLIGCSGGGGGGSGSAGNSTSTTSFAQDSTAAQIAHPLTTVVAGLGSISSSPSGINCGTSCNANFGSGVSVSLTAAPSAGYAFTGWSGACSGAVPTCTVTMGAAQSVTAAFAAITSSGAKTLYVNGATGNDSIGYGANSATNPWRTIGRAAWGSSSRNIPNLSEAAQAGDTVVVAAGTYTTSGTGSRYTPAFNPVNDGAAGNYITFQAQGAVQVAHDCGASCPSGTSGALIGTLNRRYVRWLGDFYVNENAVTVHADTGAIVVWGSDNVIIDGCRVDGRQLDYNYGDNHNGVRIEDSSNVTIRNCRIRDVRTQMSAGGDTWHHNGAGIMLYGNRDVVMENNDISTSGSGIFVKGSDNYNITIRYNLLRENRVGVRNSYSSPTLGTNRIYQNVIRDGFANGSESAGINLAEASNNWIIANNTVYNVTNGIYFGGGVFNQSNLVFRNNIVAATNNAFNAYLATTPTFTSDNQNYYNTSEWAYNNAVYTTLAAWRIAIGGDNASTTSNPQFVNAANNLRLDPASPARNAGVDILDLNGNGQTTDAINLGAYVTGNEAIGPK